MTDDLILQAREMQKRMIATTLPGELADALEAQARRIADLEAALDDAMKALFKAKFTDMEGFRAAVKRMRDWEER